MKLFILAAGKGTRLWPLTRNTPKSLIDLGDGTTLLERQIEAAINSKIFNEIIIITGYKAEQIEAKIQEYRNSINMTTIYNPFYDISNNLVSLWVANYRMLEDDFMITNGDNIYKEHVFSKVYKALENEREVIAITIDYKENYDEDDMKMILDDKRNVLRVHKEIPIEETKAESVGLALVKGSKSREVFVNTIRSLIRNKEYLNKFWLEIFNSLVNSGYIVKTVEIDKNDWKEVDFHPDIETLKRLILDGFR